MHTYMEPAYKLTMVLEVLSILAKPPRGCWKLGTPEPRIPSDAQWIGTFFVQRMGPARSHARSDKNGTSGMAVLMGWQGEL